MGLQLVEGHSLRGLEEPVEHRGQHDLGHGRDLRERRGDGVVVGHGQHGDVVEQSEEDDVQSRHGVVVRIDHDGEHADDLDGRGDAVEHVGAEPREDPARLDHGVVDHREARRGEDHVRSRAGGLGGVVHGDADLGLREGRRVVHAVAGHAHDQALVLQDEHDLALVPGQHLCEAVRGHDGLVAGCGGGPEVSGRQNARAQADEAAGLDGNVQVVAGDHLDVDAGLTDAVDGDLRVLTRGVDHRDDGRELHGAVGPLDGDRHGLVALRGEAAVDRPQLLPDLLRVRARPAFAAVGARLEHLVQQALRDLELPMLFVRAVGDGALDYGVEADKLGLGVPLQLPLRNLLTEVLVDTLQHGLVDGILLVRGIGGDARPEQCIVRGEALAGPDLRRQHPHIGRGQGARLVGAEHRHRGDLLQGGQVRDDGLLLGHLRSANRHRHLHHQGQGDRHRADDQREHVQQRVGDFQAARVDADVHHHACIHEGYQDDEANHLHDLGLEDSHLVAGRFLDQAGRLSDLGAEACLLHEAMPLALLDDAAAEKMATRSLKLALALRARDLPRDGLACKRRGVHEHGVALQPLAVRGHDVAAAEEDDVAGH
mmetsp:Transcript_148863/g.478203  ORF Transcript_148863/g.478203 Transcript_148863/m.478203 type:complete len:598 (+) Transcript_148863:919-2712(+)